MLSTRLWLRRADRVMDLFREDLYARDDVSVGARFETRGS